MLYNYAPHNFNDITGRSCAEERYRAVFGGGFLPSCSPEGLYEPVQCQDNECWCVIKETGDEIAGTRISAPEIPNCDCK